MFQDLMNIELFAGNTVADFLTLNMLASMAGSVVGAVLIVVMGWIIAAWLGSRVRRIGTSHPQLDDTLFNFLGSIVQYIVIGFTILIVLNTFGIQTTSIVAAVGAAGLAIGLALQGTLSNVAAGVMLIMFRPLKIGDFVDVAGQMGTVKDVTLNFTELASLSNTQVIIPNKEVWGNVIENYSVYPTRRAEWYFGVGYGANLKDAEDTIRETIMADPRAHAQPEPFIQVSNLGDSSVDFRVRVWCDASDYFAFTNDMTRKVKEALDAKGVDIPFPTRTIYQAAAE
ncbi:MULTISPECIES: mechanosensitive ion channel family protein [Roseobacteraceae]|uniref:Small-conductance mechanosensitive channel n=1 Tax=Pseudosulfitobacter pseudonitzschiae TaxID=1402135 RepID=A0A221K5F7_9RHOB|nr:MULTISPECIES: mechanosensitive ion channel domain-containing protein [Roseobacteraceae]ASM74216.1 small-conductance mechanosensitive channel [Pseudosulfitobacter pseudonitzschiae]